MCASWTPLGPLGASFERPAVRPNRGQSPAAKVSEHAALWRAARPTSCGRAVARQVPTARAPQATSTAPSATKRPTDRSITAPMLLHVPARLDRATMSTCRSGGRRHVPPRCCPSDRGALGEPPHRAKYARGETFSPGTPASNAIDRYTRAIAHDVSNSAKLGACWRSPGRPRWIRPGDRDTVLVRPYVRSRPNGHCGRIINSGLRTA
jgi:hypothetical protein